MMSYALVEWHEDAAARDSIAGMHVVAVFHNRQEESYESEFVPGTELFTMFDSEAIADYSDVAVDTGHDDALVYHARCIPITCPLPTQEESDHE